MDLHTRIARELLEEKALSALIWLTDRGRELEFWVGDTKYFLSRSGSAGYVSLWEGKTEQPFDSMEELIQHATIREQPFLSVWDCAEPDTLF